MLESILVIVLLAAITAAVVGYLVRAKKRGETCIGCPYAKQCGAGCHGCASTKPKGKSRQSAG